MPYMSYIERVGYEKGQRAGERTGEKRGEKRGEQRGEQRVLERQLRRRFGSLPGWVEQRLAAADSATLEDWAEKVLDAESLEQIFSFHPAGR